MKHVPVPSKGRIVLLRIDDEIVIPAIVVAVYEDPNSDSRDVNPASYYTVDLVAFTPAADPHRFWRVSYSEKMFGRWCWPPSTDAVMKVDEEEDA
jgi:hypothetical protein